MTELRCPVCGTYNDANLATTGTRGPRDGDLSICFTCCGWSVFDGSDSLRLPTEMELLTIASSEQCRQVEDALRTAKATGLVGPSDGVDDD